MAVRNIYTLYAIGTAGGIIDGMIDQNIDNGIIELHHAGDGTADSTFVASLGARPTINFTTRQLKAALDFVGIDGYEILTTDADSTLFFHQLDTFGTRLGATSHYQIAINSGFILPRSINAEMGQFATYNGDVIPISTDGDTAPMAYTASQSLAGSPTADEAYTIGDVTINGSAVTGVQGVDIDFGIQEIVAAGDGELYASFTAIMARRPSIRVRTFDAALADTYGPAGTVLSSTNTIDFKKVTQGGTTSETATTVTINEGRVRANTVRGGQDSPLLCELQITPTYDGTNAVLAIVTA